MPFLPLVRVLINQQSSLTLYLLYIWILNRCVFFTDIVNDWMPFLPLVHVLINEKSSRPIWFEYE